MSDEIRKRLFDHYRDNPTLHHYINVQAQTQELSSGLILKHLAERPEAALIVALIDQNHELFARAYPTPVESPAND